MVSVWVPELLQQERSWRVPDGASLVASPRESEFLVLTGEEPFLDEMSSFPAVKVVQTVTVGVERFVDRVPDGALLCKASGLQASVVAEWVLGVSLCWSKGFGMWWSRQRAAVWQAEPIRTFAGSRAVVLGAGEIAVAVGEKFDALGVETVLVGRTARGAVRSISGIREHVRDADIVVCLLPLTDETKGVVDASVLAAMRDGALLVNASRGSVVDSSALEQEVGSRRLFAALDVTDPEPLPATSPLWSSDHVQLTPHIAGYTEEHYDEVTALVVEQVRRYVAGDPLHGQVGAAGY